MPIDHLVLVVGAGASRNLSANNKPMPLMSDWNESLRQALAAKDASLGALVGIHHGQNGPAFEKAIGDFLTWRRSLDESARFLAMGMEVPTDTDSLSWLQRATGRADAVVETLNKSLFEEFGQDRISTVGAKSAYGHLFEALDFTGGGSLTIATTNYDPALEIAVAELGLKPNIGEVAGPGGQTFLEPENLIAMCRAGRTTPILHLHGKVGWYTQDDGSVLIHSVHHTYNETAGTPTVLWPDPEKKPTEEPGIRTLWDQFDRALAEATHVLVVGHSLHDPVLVEHIRRAGGARKAVAVHSAEDRTRVTEVMPEVTQVGIDFGPEPVLTEIAIWSGRAQQH